MKYDPEKKYTWTPEDKFEMNGEHFGLILNAFRAVLSTPESQRILLIQRANSAVEDIMANAVEKGIVKEADDNKIVKHDFKETKKSSQGE